MEKPFGRDLDSARALNERIAAAFAEEQVFRIDHYLGKETVQNIMLLRFGNAIFEPVWNNRYVDHVQITMAETLGVEGRGGYYETAGALRDMVQNHMLQLLCLVAMEPPVDLRPDSVRDEKLKVLRSLVPLGAAEVGTETVRGQYARGTADGAEVPGYREEDGVDPASPVETYAALRVHLASWRWAGVPFLLRTGKRLSRRATEISLHFRRPPVRLFADGAAPQPDTLVFRIQPREGIMVVFNAKVPGPTTDMRTVAMDFSYGTAFGDELPEAYERLLLDAMIGDATLFMRRDEIEASWEFVTGVLEGWRAHRRPGARAVPGRQPGPRGRGAAARRGRPPVAAPVTLPLDPRRIEAEIARMRERESTGFGGGAKANLFNLVVVIPRRRGSAGTGPDHALDTLLGRRPARIIRLAAGPAGAIGATVSGRCFPGSIDRGVCLEQIDVTAGGDPLGERRDELGAPARARHPDVPVDRRVVDAGRPAARRGRSRGQADRGRLARRRAGRPRSRRCTGCARRRGGGSRWPTSRGRAPFPCGCRPRGHSILPAAREALDRIASVRARGRHRGRSPAVLPLARDAAGVAAVSRVARRRAGLHRRRGR